MNSPRSVVAIVLVAVLFVAGCGSTSGVTTERSPLESAKLAYVDASITYESTMFALQDLRRARLVTDAQWSRIDQAQKLVQQYTPLVRAALDQWAWSGTKPVSFDATWARLVGAFGEATAVMKEVK